MQPTKYNVFQRLTRQWDSLHPYNAAQMFRIAGLPDLDALDAHWTSTIKELGLGYVRAGKRDFTWEQIDNACGPILNESDPDALQSMMSDQLNRRFDNDNELPFRPFVIRADANSYFLGIVYHHWVADSYSIRVMLREWFLRIHDPARARRSRLLLARDGYWKHFGPSRASWSLGNASMAMVRWTAQFRQARRITPEGFADLGVHFTLHRAPAGLIPRVASQARKLGVTVNDVFLAAMAEICSLRVLEPVNFKRRDLALGTIVDLRSRAQNPKMAETFGLFLGFTSVFCRQKDLANWDRLLMRVHEQNARQKNTGGAESSMMRMVAGLVFARMFKGKSLLELYRKRFALSGGISNINLNRDWPAEYHPWPLLEYVRVSPCGPMMPIVFTPTTLGQQFNFGLTCRDSAIPPDAAPELANMFLRRLEWFSSTEEAEIRGRFAPAASIRAAGY